MQRPGALTGSLISILSRSRRKIFDNGGENLFTANDAAAGFHLPANSPAKKMLNKQAASTIT